MFFNNSHIIALTACHNRAELTATSLKSLMRQNLPKGCRMSVVVVNDGCTDNTLELISSISEKIKILNGTGNLYWAGGMRFAWENWIYKQDYDFLFVFNDDIYLEKNALITIMKDYFVAKEKGPKLNVVSGAFKDHFTGKLTYGGYLNCSFWHPLRFKILEPNGSVQKIDTLNMNAALIPNEVITKIGFLSSYFTHGGADTEFGLRLRKYKGQVWLSKRTIGTCSRNPKISNDEYMKLTISGKFAWLTNKKNEPLYVRYKLFKNHGGPFWWILFFGPYVRIILNHSLNRLKHLFEIRRNL